MAYLARIAPAETFAEAAPDMVHGRASDPDFSPLEWSVIRLARVDRLWTLRPRRGLRRLFDWIIGRTGSPELANPRLEALRRISVLSWHFGFTVPGDDVADFLAAGFTLDQYELLVSSVRATIAGVPTKITSLEVAA